MASKRLHVTHACFGFPKQLSFAKYRVSIVAPSSFSPHLTTQSGPGSQTARPQARNTASGCNAAPSLHHNTAFAI